MQGNKFIIGTASLFLFGALSTGVTTVAQAMGAFVPTIGLNNQNPADLFTTPHYQVIIGSDVVGIDFATAITVNGVAQGGIADTTNVMPMFRIAYRVSPKWVIGMDYNHPGWTGENYGINFAINPFAARSYLHTENVNPRASYQVNDRLVLGAGLDITREWVNFTQGGGPVPVYTIADVDGFGLGFDAGVTVVVTPSTYLSVTGSSPVTIVDNGISSFGAVQVPNAVKVTTPTEFVLRLTQFLSPSWLVQFLGEWSEASSLQEFKFRNTAFLGQTIFPLWENNSFLVQLYTHYQVNNNWGLAAGASYEDGIEPTVNNYVNFPLGNWFVLFAGPDFKINKTTTFQIAYGHLWEAATINYTAFSITNIFLNPAAIQQPLIGRSNLNINLIDLRLTFQA